jgi:SNF2 family DNA or RNA helicase
MFYVDEEAALAVPASPVLRAYLPEAPVLDWDGQRYVALPHDEQTTLFLRGQGVPVDAPIQRRYDWSGTLPWKVQRITAGETTLQPRMFILNDMGTGKTRSVYFAYDWLRQQGKVRAMLVVAPLSILDTVWRDQAYFFFPHLRVVVVHGSAERRRQLLAQPADVYVINHDGLKVIEPELLARRDFDVVVLDEQAVFRNHSTELWKACDRVIENRAYVWGCTGNPTPDGPLDAYGQIKLIRPENLRGLRWKAFREQTMIRVGPFRWLPRKGAQQMVADMFQPCVRFTRAECIDLPPTLRMVHRCELTPVQKRVMKVLTDAMAVQIGGATVTAVNAGVLLSKLVQVGTGLVYDGGKVPVVVGAPHREKLLLDILQQFNASKALIFCPFIALVEHIHKLIPGSAMVHGAIGRAERAAIFRDYQHGCLQYIVAQPRCMSHGLTLTAGNVIVWYAPYARNETVEQANARQARPGQTRTTYIIEIEGSYAERRVYLGNKTKESWANVLLDVIKQGA